MSSSVAMDYGSGCVRSATHSDRQGTTVANTKGIMRDLATLDNVIKLVSDLEPQQIRLLLNIAMHPGLTQQELADRCDIALSSVSRNLMALGEWHRFGKPGLNLVEKTEDPHERRRQIAFLTIKGKKLVEHILAVLRPGEAISFEAPSSREYLTRAYRAR